MKSSSNDYKDLLVWQEAMQLATVIYKISEGFPRTEQFGLQTQVRRAAVSIPSNIAEGQARRSRREFAQFLHVSLGSLAELDTQLLIAQNLNILKEDDYLNIVERVHKIQKMTWGLIKSIKDQVNDS